MTQAVNTSPALPPPCDLLLSVLIPLADEEGNILPLAEEITKAMTQNVSAKDSYEIIFIDDLSRDKSRAEAVAAMARFPNIRVLAHAARYGKSQALRNGLYQARGQWILTMDGDGQNDPADIARMLDAALARGKDARVIVAGVRTNRQAETSKRWASRAANSLRQALLDDDCPDTGCALKLYRRDAFMALPFFDNIHRFIPALFKLYGHEVICVPVNDRPRTRGASKYTNIHRALVGVFDMLGVVWLQRRLQGRFGTSTEIKNAAQNRPDIAAE